MLLQTVSRGHAQRAWATAFLLLPLASIVWGQQPDTPRRPKVTIHVVTPPPPPADTPLVHHVAPDAPLLVELNQKTQLAKAETVFVFSRGFPDVYEGQPIDRRFYDVLQPFYGELAFPMKEPEVFATYRVALGDTRTGYLLRVPGMYQPSAIDLWVYDSRMVRFEPPLQLAEAYGDAGAEYELSGWLVDLDGDGRLDVVLRQQTSYTRMETDSLISQSDSLWIVSWANGVRTRQLRPLGSSLGTVFDPQRWRRPWGGAENADGARFIWSMANHYAKSGNVPYVYVPTKDIPSSPDFREVPADSIRSGDLAWWPTFVGIVMRPPPIGLLTQTSTTPTSVRTGDTGFLLDTLIARKGSVRFFRRLLHN